MTPLLCLFVAQWPKQFRHSVSLTLLVTLAACATKPIDNATTSKASALQNTQWTLIGYGPDGSADTLTEVQPNSYTLTFSNDGNAQFKFDCNRGTGSWTAGVGSDADQLRFEGIATTSALCRPGSASEMVAANMAKVRKYEVYDGRLTLKLQDDSIVYVWDRID